MKQLINVQLEVDSAYDDPEALIEDLNLAVLNEENVSLTVAGNRYELGVNTARVVTE